MQTCKFDGFLIIFRYQQTKSSDSCQQPRATWPQRTKNIICWYQKTNSRDLCQQLHTTWAIASFNRKLHKGQRANNCTQPRQLQHLTKNCTKGSLIIFWYQTTNSRDLRQQLHATSAIATLYQKLHKGQPYHFSVPKNKLK